MYSVILLPAAVFAACCRCTWLDCWVVQMRLGESVRNSVASQVNDLPRDDVIIFTPSIFSVLRRADWFLHTGTWARSIARVIISFVYASDVGASNHISCSISPLSPPHTRAHARAYTHIGIWFTSVGTKPAALQRHESYKLRLRNSRLADLCRDRLTLQLCSRRNKPLPKTLSITFNFFHVGHYHEYHCIFNVLSIMDLEG